MAIWNDLFLTAYPPLTDGGQALGLANGNILVIGRDGFGAYGDSGSLIGSKPTMSSSPPM